MNTKQDPEYYEDMDESPRSSHRIKGIKRAKIQAMLRPVKTTTQAQQMIQQNDSHQTFQFTYKAARFEEGWLLDSLGYFYEQHWIADVLRKIKVGKEASVYLCVGGAAVPDRLVAAKVYRPRMFRSLKNDQLYRLGRDVLDEDGKTIVDLGMLKAHKKRTTYGEQIRHQSWIAYESRALETLQEAGADVPHVFEMNTNGILMTYIGDEQLGAPILSTVTLGLDEARSLFERVVHNIELMLANGIVHGDLSAYNILYWNGEITLIDFPQMVSPVNNPLAYRIFKRDVQRVCDYFATQGVESNPRQLAEGLWQKYGYKMVPDVHPKFLDEGDTRDRKMWEEQKSRYK
jgi:RIO kinase 1